MRSSKLKFRKLIPSLRQQSRGWPDREKRSNNKRWRGRFLCKPNKTLQRGRRSRLKTKKKAEGEKFKSSLKGRSRRPMKLIRRR
jgi:hypothetical protein